MLMMMPGGLGKEKQTAADAHAADGPGKGKTDGR